MVDDGVYFNGTATTHLFQYNFIKNITSVGDSCTITLANPGGIALNDTTYFEDIKIYSGGGNLVWRGLVYDIIPNKDGTLTIEGSGYMRLLMNRFHTGTYSAKVRSFIVENLVDTYGGYITTTGNITATSGTITRTFKTQSVYDIVLTMANEELYDFWVDSTLDFNFKERNITASGDSLDYTSGRTVSVDVPNEGKTMYNRVYVYGDSNQDGVCDIVARVDDRASQLLYGVVREYEPIKDTSLRTVAECEARGNEIINSNSTIVPTIIVKTFGKDTLPVGQTISMYNYSSQYGIDDGEYLILSIAYSNITKIHTLRLAKYDSDTADQIAEIIRRLRRREEDLIDDTAVAVNFLKFYEFLYLQYNIEVIETDIGSSFILGHSTNGVLGETSAGIVLGRSGTSSTALISYTETGAYGGGA